MKALIKRELKNYLKNPIFWVGLVVVVIGVYQMLSPYLKIHYFQSDQEIQDIHMESPLEGGITEGYIPSSPKQQIELAGEVIRKDLIEELEVSKEDADEMISTIQNMSIPEACEYLKKNHFNNAEYIFDDYAYHQGNMEEVNGYLDEKMEKQSFSYYFTRKFTDSGGLYMAFFSTILFAFLFLRDTKKDTYELLHTKPVRPWQYVLGKIGGGFLTSLIILAVLNLVFAGLCILHIKEAGLASGSYVFSTILGFVKATCIYILPNMLMIICVYTIVALLFKNPLPATPLLFLYIVYSNMGSIGPDGNYGYFGRPLAIVVRFPGQFFDTAPPPLVLMNQIFLILTSCVIIALSVFIWKRRRVY